MVDESFAQAEASDGSPLVTFVRIDNRRADQLLLAWKHWLGPCNRPFGRQSFGLLLANGVCISVAVSASTVSSRCAGYERTEIVELARCASDPEYRWATRVCLRLWRELASQEWSRRYWPVKALVSYSNALKHTGNLYRFDGWTRAGERRGGVTGPNAGWQKQKQYPPKTVWVFPLTEPFDRRR